MDQTFFVFIILFAIIIIYLFKQKNCYEEMKEQLNQYVAEEHFQNQVNNAEYKDDITEYDLTKNTPVTKNNHVINLNPEPMNKPIAPVRNGYSTTLIYNHPDKINGCDIGNIAPMDYYKEVNEKINNKNNNIMNGDLFDDVIGYTDQSEDGYYFVD